MVVGLVNRDRAGQSAERRFKTLSKAWRRRRFGRWFGVGFWTLYLMVFVLVLHMHPSSRVSLYLGIGFGAFAALWMLLPEGLMPAHITRWQLGAWGEQKTESELRPLRREGWALRHDVAWGERWNHDHVVAGPAVYLLNTKNVPDSRVTVEGRHLRISYLDSPNDGYLADRWIPGIEREAKTLAVRLERELGFPVAVYAVIVVWGAFDPEQAHIGNVCVVHGLGLADWLRSRPVDLVKAQKRERVTAWVRALPRAEPGSAGWSTNASDSRLVALSGRLRRNSAR